MAGLARRSLGDALCVYEAGADPEMFGGIASSGAPPVMPGTGPVAIFVTAVFALR